MKICICRNISDKEFKSNLKNHEGKMIETNINALENFHLEVSGCGRQCGSCLDYIKSDIIEPHNKIVSQVHKVGQEIKVNTPASLTKEPV